MNKYEALGETLKCIAENPVILKKLIQEEIDSMTNLGTHKTFHFDKELLTTEYRKEQFKQRQDDFFEKIHEEFDDILDHTSLNTWFKDSPALEDSSFKIFKFIGNNKIDESKIKIIELLLGIE